MKKSTLLFFGLLACIFFVSCAQPQKMYYFGKYSQTLYGFEKNQNEEFLLTHQQELEKIIAESKIKNLPVPPGIYAELGYINLKAQKNKEAIILFEAESKLYPESGHLMERLIQSATAAENTENALSQKTR